MSSYRLTPRAEADLEEIVDYIIERSGADRAERVAREIFDATLLVSENPGIGHVREDLTDEPVRFWSVYSYLVVYRPDTIPIEVLRVVHGARDLPPLLE